MRANLQDKSKWHKWFAWYPVRIENTLVWFEEVNRRWIPNASSAGDSSGYSFDVAGWEYATVGSIKYYQSSLDGIEWYDITKDAIECALMNGYEVRSKTI